LRREQQQLRQELAEIRRQITTPQTKHEEAEP
jgi:hypothetical protein